MTLLELAKAKEAEEEKRAEDVEAERKRYEAEERLIGSHPLLKMGVERNVRDAYFQGLVFAAYADDAQVDKDEYDALMRIAKTLAVNPADISETISRITGLDDARKLNLVEEIASLLNGQKCALLFLCEFSFLWMSHENFNRGELEGWRNQLSKWMNFTCDADWFVRFDEVVLSAEMDGKTLLKLEDRLSKEEIDYFIARASEKLVHVLKNGAEEKAREERLRQGHEATARDSTEDPAGTAFSVWLVRKPEKSYEMIEGMIGSVLHACGGTGKLSELLYRYGTGVLCSNVSLNMAKAVRSCVERFGGVVEIKPS